MAAPADRLLMPSLAEATARGYWEDWTAQPSSDRKERPRHVRQGRAHVVRGVGQDDVRIRDAGQDEPLSRWAGERSRREWAGREAGLDSTVFRLEAAAGRDLALDGLFVGGLRVIVAPVDAGVNG